MAGPFALHKQVIADARSLQSHWRDQLKLAQATVPELANFASTLEGLVPIFKREQELFFKLLFSKNNQMRNFKFWQLSKQVNSHVRALSIDRLASQLQSVHLQVSQGRKTKPSPSLSYIVAFIMHQLRSHYWVSIDTCGIIKSAYDQYCGIVELSHFMPISLAVMAVLSRMHLLCTRIAIVAATCYNLLSEHLFHVLSTDNLLKNDWELWLGKLETNLAVPEEVKWQDLATPSDSKNQKAIDMLNRALERAATDDDLGEAFEFDEDDTRDIASSLVYRPPSTSSTPAEIPTRAYEPSLSRPDEIEPKKLSHSVQAASPASSISSKRDGDGDMHKEKTKEKHKHKEGEKRKDKAKEKRSTNTLPSPSVTPSTSNRDKDKHRKKVKSDMGSAESKKRKSTTNIASDDIDDLFGLLVPDKKKQKDR